MTPIAVENEPRKKTRLRYVLGCVIGVVIIAIALCVLFPFLPRLLRKQVNRGDYGDVARAFAEALKDNDRGFAKSLAHPTQWARIDSWIDRHTVYWCFSTDTGGGGDVVPERVRNKDKIEGWWYFYGCFAAGYRFMVRGIALEQTDTSWQVVDWEKICETRDRYTSRCE